MVTVSNTEFSGENSAEVRRINHESIASVDRSLSPSSRPPSSSVSAPVSTPSENCDGNAMATKVWNKTSDGGIVDGGAPIMGADSWPDLVESARSSPKSVADSPHPKPTRDGEVSIPLAAQGSINSPPQRPATNNAKSNPPSLKQPVFARQRYSRRGGGGGGGGGGSSMGGPARGFYHPLPPPSPPPFPVFQIPGSSYYNMAPAIIDPFPGNPLFSPNIWDPRAVGGFMPQTNFATDQRNFFPKENFAFHPPGDGHYYHNNRGGKRDHDRRIYSNVQDARFQNHMPPPRGFMSPSPPYIAQLPQHVRPHGNPIPPPPPPEFVYAPTLPMEPYSDMPPMPPMQPMPQPSMYYPAVDPTLFASLIYQIEYYFSDANLVTDAFLRFNMDDQGWVPISLIADFSKVKKLTSNIQLIVEALRTSTEVELQDHRIRKRNGWMKWPLNSNEVRTDSPSSSGSNHDNLATSFQRVRLDDGMN